MQLKYQKSNTVKRLTLCIMSEWPFKMILKHNLQVSLHLKGYRKRRQMQSSMWRPTLQQVCFLWLTTLVYNNQAEFIVLQGLSSFCFFPALPQDWIWKLWQEKIVILDFQFLSKWFQDLQYSSVTQFWAQAVSLKKYNSTLRGLYKTSKSRSSALLFQLRKYHDVVDGHSLHK